MGPLCRLPRHLLWNWVHSPRIHDQLRSLGHCWVHLPMRYQEASFRLGRPNEVSNLNAWLIESHRSE